MYRQAFDSVFNSLPENIPLLNKEPKKLQVLYNNIVDREGHIKDYNSYLRWANDDAKKLIKQIKKEYDF